MGSAGTLIN